MLKVLAARLPTRWAAAGRQVGRHTAACASRYDLWELRMAAGERMRHTQADKFHGLSHGQCERNEIAGCRRYRRERENARRREASIRKKCRGLSAVSNANANGLAWRRCRCTGMGWDGIYGGRREAASGLVHHIALIICCRLEHYRILEQYAGESRTVCGRALSLGTAACDLAGGSEAHKLRCGPW